MPYISWQDPKTLKKKGTAVGMYALPKVMQVVSVSDGYGLFFIMDEQKGYYLLAFNSAILRIKKKDVDVYN